MPHFRVKHAGLLTNIPKNFIPRRDVLIVKRLRSDGTVAIGETNILEFRNTPGASARSSTRNGLKFRKIHGILSGC
ncbi:MAG: hypothetical protein PVF53_10175 [Desulfobacterales bacterium]